MTGRILKMLNHHYRIGIALIKTKLRTKLSSSNQQQPTAIRRQKNRNRRKNQKEEMKNSPHSNWSLHNHPPREVPEHNTGTADSKRARPAAEQQPAG